MSGSGDSRIVSNGGTSGDGGCEKSGDQPPCGLAASLLSTLLVLAGHLLGLTVFLYVSTYVAGYYLEFVYDDDTLLERSTIMALDFHHFIADYWYLAVGALLIFDGVALRLVESRSARPNAAKGWLLGGFLLLVVAAIGMMLVALSQPVA